MVRIVGVDIPDNKRLEISLRYLYGIGPALAQQIIDKLSLDPNKRAHRLTADEISKITALLQNEYMIEGWVMQNLGPFNNALQEIGLAGYAYPEVSMIEDPGAFAYLVVLSPEAEALDIWKFIKNLAYLGGGLIFLRIVYKIFNKYDLIQPIIDVIKQILY